MNDDRDRGLLSPADRAYLRGETAYGSVQSERNARARIRDRVYDGLLDFEVLVEGLSDRDRRLVTESRADGTALFDGLVSTVAFVYRAAEDAGLDFETLLREAVAVAEADRDRTATVDLDLTYDALSAERLRERLASGEELSLTEIAYLHRSDAVRDDELAEYLAREPDVDDDRIQSRVTDF